MRKILAALVLALALPVLSHASWFSGPGPDYSQGAGNEFYCASTFTVTTQAGISVTSPTWSLTNPPGSGKNLVILDVGINVMSSPAAAASFLLAYSTGVTPSTTTTNPQILSSVITPALIGYSTGTAVAQCFIQGTLPMTPRQFRVLGGTTGASAISGVVLTDQTNGKVVIPPGYVVSLQATSAAAIQSHVLWREDPR